MNTRTSLTRMSTLVAMIGCTFTGTHVCAQDEAVMSVDDRAPLQATLLPTVSVVADAAYPDAENTWSVADTRPLRVTLMPTVRVTAQAEPLAVTLMPTVRVYAQALPDATPASLPVLQTVASTQQASLTGVSRTSTDSAPGRNLQVVPR